jgi:hypothetical protein
VVVKAAPSVDALRASMLRSPIARLSDSTRKKLSEARFASCVRHRMVCTASADAEWRRRAAIVQEWFLMSMNTASLMRA